MMPTKMARRLVMLVLLVVAPASGAPSAAIEGPPESRAVAHDAAGDAKRGVYFVIDGMNGHASPDVAGTVAVEATDAALAKAKPSPAALQAALKAASVAIFSRAKDEVNLKGMGATGAALWIDGGKAYVAHVGDCRVFVFRDGKLTQLTQDHSLLNDYLKTRKLTAEEIEAFPAKNVVVRALGVKDKVDVDVATHPTHSKDLWVIASVGLTRRVEAAEMTRLLAAARGKPEVAAQGLADAARTATSTTRAKPAFVVIAIP